MQPAYDLNFVVTMHKVQGSFLDRIIVSNQRGLKPSRNDI